MADTARKGGTPEKNSTPPHPPPTSPHTPPTESDANNTHLSITLSTKIYTYPSHISKENQGKDQKNTNISNEEKQVDP